MKKNLILLGIIIFALITGCGKKQSKELNEKYVLKGNLDGIENETWIYLLLDSKTIDSAKIVENKFELSNKISQPKEFDLYIKNTQNYSRIWLEPREIEFKAKNGAFRHAIITGSKTQEEQDALTSLLRDYRDRRDSLTTILRDLKSNGSQKKSAKDGLKNIYANHLQIEQNFIKNNPKSYVSVSLLDFYSTSLGKTKTKELFNILSDSLKLSSFGKNIDRFLALNKSPKIGEKYVDFSMTNESNKLIRLSEFEGKLVLLDFWASWCGPCIEEYPALKEAYATFSNKGFEIVSVSEDQTRQRWIKAIEDNELDWVNLWQEDGNKADPYLIYGINGIPDNFLINKEGLIVERNLRGKKLIEAIEKNL